MSTWPPTCSQDVREAREAAEESALVRRRHEAVAAILHEHYCRDGWIGEDAHGRPQPCPKCHPGLEERLNRSRGLPRPLTDRHDRHTATAAGRGGGRGG